MEQYFQRDSPYHVGGFDGSHMLPADANHLSQLFLGQQLALAVVSNGAPQVTVPLRII